jgi:hypothetical protein
MDKSEVAVVVSIVSVCISVVTLIWTVSWSVFTWRHQRREKTQKRDRLEQESKESIAITVRTGFSENNRPRPHIEIVNTGKVPVYLKQVMLAWKEKGIWTRSVQLIVCGQSGLGSPTYALQCGRSVIYQPGAGFWEQVSGSPPDEALDAWVTVESESGGTWRCGENVLQTIKDFWQGMDSNSG